MAGWCWEPAHIPLRIQPLCTAYASWFYQVWFRLLIILCLCRSAIHFWRPVKSPLWSWSVPLLEAPSASTLDVLMQWLKVDSPCFPCCKVNKMHCKLLTNVHEWVFWHSHFWQLHQFLSLHLSLLLHGGLMQYHMSSASQGIMSLLIIRLLAWSL